MSAGNLRDQGGQGKNFSYQFRTLQLLGQIKTLLQSSTGSSIVITLSDVMTDGLLTSIPDGYMTEIIIFTNTGLSDGEIELGSTAGDDDIQPALTIGSAETVTINLNYYPSTTSYPIYITETGGWTGVALDVKLILRKV